ncbi:MAG: arsenic efflux protein [Clostridia bacterium]|nr:arsenic efflux protein [Clostridia bacterium]
MKDVILDTVLDTLKLIPFLFVTYLVMEFIEQKASEKLEEKIRRSGRLGPVLGGILGIVPQCGFSASAASLYSGRLISAGTLIAVFLSTSDEMLPIFISERVKIPVMVEILAIKAVSAMIIGLGVDVLLGILHKEKKDLAIHSICEKDNCHCEEGSIFKSALLHSARIVAFIFVISFALNTVIHFVGEDNLGRLFLNVPVLSCAVSALVGLIPNCAASVVITELYLSGVISAGAMIAGLLTGCGIGILVLFRTNRGNLKENVSIAAAMYFFGVVIGGIIELMGITIG